MSAVKRYMSAVGKLGCLVCGAPPQLHHPREGVGAGQRESDWCVVPLCRTHHDMWHKQRGDFRMMYKQYQTEMDMLAEVIRRMNT